MKYFTSIKSFDDYDYSDTSSLKHVPVFVSYDDVLNAIKKLKREAWVVKNYPQLFLQPLSAIFSASLNLSYVLTSMKRSIITPVPKVKNPICPVTIGQLFLALPIFSNNSSTYFLEKCVKCLVKEESFSDQHAFMEPS